VTEDCFGGVPMYVRSRIWLHIICFS